MLYNIILNIYKKHTKCTKLVNNSQFIDTFYKHFLYDLVNNKITFKKCTLFIENAIILYTTTNNVNHERTSIMPYTKWHYKAQFSKIK
jgi:hypothetical protein